jgi:hypothetical protein
MMSKGLAPLTYIEANQMTRTVPHSPSDLISPAYRQTQIELHAAPRGYGGKGDKWSMAVASIAFTRDVTTILDYGCGQGSLRASLSTTRKLYTFNEYDPAISGKDALPEPADLVVCTDVLEHIEPEKLSTALAHLYDLTKMVLFVVIATRPSNKTLSDGRNAHLILEDDAWWLARLTEAGFVQEPDEPKSPLKKPSREFVGVFRKATP